MVTWLSYPTLVFLCLFTFSSLSLRAGCGEKAFSCPLDPSFLREAEEFSALSFEKVKSTLSSLPSAPCFGQSPNLGDLGEDLCVDPKTDHRQGMPKLPDQVGEKAFLGNDDKKVSTLYVFVSFSMGEKSLLNLAREAKDYGATLVLKGFKAGSLKKTVAALSKLIQKTGEGVLIDPELFERFDIKTVPTIVLTSNNTSQSDQLVGHVSLKHVLETFAKEGELKEEAQALLNQGRQP